MASFFLLILNLLCLADSHKLPDSNPIIVLKSYIKEHGYETIKKENPQAICNRQFVFARMGGWGEIGNGLCRFLNNALLSVVLNRTLVMVELPDSKKIAHFLPWITELEKLKDLLKNSNCTERLSSEVYSLSSGGRDYRCLDAENSQEPILQDNSLCAGVFRMYHSQSGALLSTEGKYRAEMLFNHSNNLGAYSSDGYMALATVRHSHEMHELSAFYLNDTFIDNKMTIHSNDVFTVALHVRHQTLDFQWERELDKKAYACLNTSLEIIRNQNKNLHKKCIILIATDRNHTLHRFLSHVNSLNCEARHVERAQLELLHPNSGRQIGHEHGDWNDGFIANADLYVLSKAQYLIGTYGSTYSRLIGSYITAHAMSQGIEDNLIFWYDENNMCGQEDTNLEATPNFCTSNT
jgi:hypothetical protein